LTTPNQAKRRSGRDAPRTYAWPPLPPHEFEVISVTSATSGGLPKPFLEGWAAKTAAECAVDKYDLVGKLIADDGEQAAIDYIKSARYRDRDKKANRGTIVHAALEAYLAGKEMTPENIDAALKEKRVPPNLWKSARGMVRGLWEFLADEEPEVYWSESTVYSRTHGYAGTPDVLARMRVGGSLVPAVIDVKTSKSIYDEVALQLCAYARADFVGLDDGTEAALHPGVPDGERIDYGVAVRPMASGKYEKAVFTLSDEVYDLFLGCLAVASKRHVLETARRPS
jgi:hypothetical protein